MAFLCRVLMLLVVVALTFDFFFPSYFFLALAFGFCGEYHVSLIALSRHVMSFGCITLNSSKVKIRVLTWVLELLPDNQIWQQDLHTPRQFIVIIKFPPTTILCEAFYSSWWRSPHLLLWTTSPLHFPKPISLVTCHMIILQAPLVLCVWWIEFKQNHCNWSFVTQGAFTFPCF